MFTSVDLLLIAFDWLERRNRRVKKKPISIVSFISFSPIFYVSYKLKTIIALNNLMIRLWSFIRWNSE